MTRDWTLSFYSRSCSGWWWRMAACWSLMSTFWRDISFQDLTTTTTTCCPSPRTWRVPARWYPRCRCPSAGAGPPTAGVSDNPTSTASTTRSAASTAVPTCVRDQVGEQERIIFQNCIVGFLIVTKQWVMTWRWTGCRFIMFLFWLRSW